MYTIQEGTLTLGTEEHHDRSVNVLSFDAPEWDGPRTLVITRDELMEGEDLEGCLRRQLKLLSRQTADFKELARRPVEVGPAKLPGFEIESRYKHAHTPTWQIQALFQLPSGALLIFTLTGLSAITEEFREYWRALLHSFLPE